MRSSRTDDADGGNKEISSNSLAKLNSFLEDQQSSVKYLPSISSGLVGNGRVVDILGEVLLVMRRQMYFVPLLRLFLCIHHTYNSTSGGFTESIWPYIHARWWSCINLLLLLLLRVSFCCLAREEGFGYSGPSSLLWERYWKHKSGSSNCFEGNSASPFCILFIYKHKGCIVWLVGWLSAQEQQPQYKNRRRKQLIFCCTFNSTTLPLEFI